MEEKKTALREQLKAELQTINKNFHEQLSQQIAENLYKDSSFIQANSIGITISNYPEVNTYSIIRTCWQLGKTVSVPKCLPKTKEMIFRKIETFEQLEKVYSNLYEPVEHITEATDHHEMDLLIVPGLAYTKSGYRIGFGGGYYDRYLQKYSGITVSLAFQKQIVEKLPIEPHDQPVSKIITENKVYSK
ncbi:5-formyltetrahydrofolate cyclo-ligase [Niallia sp. 01092]|uniref:5-formyltetrahydrofolate cyclo-ligase n=1 Tax=unclassified Niallia TaxID=2837522 RepID=UPI003FD2A4D4